MAASPPKDSEVEQARSGDEEGDMDRTEEAQGALGDFEVKEQDRWLPIANGWSSFISCVTLMSTLPLEFDLFVLSRDFVLTCTARRLRTSHVEALLFLQKPVCTTLHAGSLGQEMLSFAVALLLLKP